MLAKKLLLTALLTFYLPLTKMSDFQHVNRETEAARSTSDHLIVAPDIELISATAYYYDKVKPTAKEDRPIKDIDGYKAYIYLDSASQHSAQTTLTELTYQGQTIPCGSENIQAQGWYDISNRTKKKIFPNTLIRTLQVGIVARLKNSTPSEKEYVAPVVFYHSVRPQSVNEYLFTFKVHQDQKVYFRLYREGTLKFIYSNSDTSQTLITSSLRTVSIDMSLHKRDSYRLTCEDEKGKVLQTVQFFHQPDPTGLP